MIRVIPQVGGGMCFDNVPDNVRFIRVRRNGLRYCLTNTTTNGSVWFSHLVSEDYCDHVPTVDVE